MDPVSALSIAAACAQFIDFACKFLRLCERVHDEQTIPDATSLKEKLDELGQLETHLRLPNKSPFHQHPQIQALSKVLEVDEDKVERVGERCKIAALHAKIVLDWLQKVIKPGILHSIRVARKWPKMQKKVETLDREVDGCQRSYDSAILHKVSGGLMSYDRLVLHELEERSSRSGELAPVTD